ncbi:MAG: hypothetical protein ACE5JR_09125 [Gemmatimonadota bacterium]
MNTMTIEGRAGPCDSPAEIRSWIDELLELRFALHGYQEFVREIDDQLSLAVGWLSARMAGVQCA